MSVDRRLARVTILMGALLLVCGTMFDGASDDLVGRSEILVRDGRMSEVGRSVSRRTARS